MVNNRPGSSENDTLFGLSPKTWLEGGEKKYFYSVNLKSVKEKAKAISRQRMKEEAKGENFQMNE